MVFNIYNQKSSFLKFVFFFGYSLVFFVPASILCVVPVSWWQWAAVMLGFGASSWLVFNNLAELVAPEDAASGLVAVGVAVVMQFIFAVTIKIKFFYS